MMKEDDLAIFKGLLFIYLDKSLTELDGTYIDLT